jgi:hypothetical protein
VEVEFPLRVTSATIPAGWRIRLALAGADFPVVWPPRGRFALSLDARGSSLTLPTVPERDETRYVDIAEMDGDGPRAPVAQRRMVSDWEVIRAGEDSVYRRVTGGTEIQPGLVYQTDQSWTVRVDDDDPATTRAWTESRASLERPGWRVETRGTIGIEGSDRFEVTIELAASHNEDEVFHRTWKETIPRVWS